MEPVAPRLPGPPLVADVVNGGERAEVVAGEAVTFTAQIEVPPAPGRVLAAKWDFEGGHVSGRR